MSLSFRPFPENRFTIGCDLLIYRNGIIQSAELPLNGGQHGGTCTQWESSRYPELNIEVDSPGTCKKKASTHQVEKGLRMVSANMAGGCVDAHSGLRLGAAAFERDE
jgi:hypothetical protein